MGCCGQGRTELKTGAQTNRRRNNGATATAAPSIDPPEPAAPARPGGAAAMPQSPLATVLGEVTLRYLARSSVVVVGPFSGKLYRFSGLAPVQRVARADAESLVASGHFRRES